MTSQYPEYANRRNPHVFRRGLSPDRGQAIAMLFVAFLVNGLAQGDVTKISADGQAKSKFYNSATQEIFSGFSKTNYLAWFGLAIPLVFFAGVDQTRDLTKAFIWLILIGVIIFRGEKVAAMMKAISEGFPSGSDSVDTTDKTKTPRKV